MEASVDDFHGEAKGFSEVERHPAAAEVVGFSERARVDDRAGIADGDAVVLQSLVASLILFHHAARSHGGAGGGSGAVLSGQWRAFLTLVPPTSMTRILGDLADGFGFIEAP